MTSVKRPAGYARLSVAERRQIDQGTTEASLSIRAQVAAGEALCRDRGWPAPAWYTDDGVSASVVGKRPQFEALIADIAAGVIDAVICRDDDRFLRHPQELEIILPVLEENRTFVYFTEDDESYFDLSSPKGQRDARVSVANARYEGQRKSKRQKSNNRQRFNEGQPYGRRIPFGYKRSTAGSYDLVTEQADAIRSAASHVLSGGTLTSVARDWNALGFKTSGGRDWTGDSVKMVLINPTIKGHRLYQPYSILTRQISRKERPAHTTKGSWEPILTEATWEAVNNLLASRTNTGGNKIKWLGGGIYYCSTCYEGPKSPRVHSHYLSYTRKGEAGPERQYRCDTCMVRYKRANALDSEIEKTLLVVLRNPDDYAGAFRDEQGGSGVDWEAKRDTLLGRRRALALTLANGLISDDDFNAAIGPLGAEIAGAEQKMAEDAGERETVRQLLDFGAVAERWASQDIEVKRAVLKRVVTRVVLLPESPGVDVSSGGAAITVKTTKGVHTIHVGSNAAPRTGPARQVLPEQP